MVLSPADQRISSISVCLGSVFVFDLEKIVLFTLLQLLQCCIHISLCKDPISINCFPDTFLLHFYKYLQRSLHSALIYVFGPPPPRTTSSHKQKYTLKKAKNLPLCVEQFDVTHFVLVFVLIDCHGP